MKPEDKHRIRHRRRTGTRPQPMPPQHYRHGHVTCDGCNRERRTITVVRQQDQSGMHLYLLCAACHHHRQPQDYCCNR